MRTILQALKLNNFKEAEQLIINGHQTNEQDEAGLSSLHIATLKGNVTIVKRLLEAGSNPNIRTITDAVFDEDQGANHDDAIVSSLRGLGNKTPLHIAAKESLYEIGKLLLDFGADINTLDAGLCTPLHWSANKGDEQFVRLLLEHNANPNARDLAWSTPLHEATRKNHVNVVKLLMNYNSDPYIKDISEQSAFEIAQNNITMLNIYQCYVVRNTSGTMH
ncbi:MAG TPA: ankyrin repeat domain-containing protein [Gammaproteobacteria bacterium]|nr:ankyrin repeat domain-containing protein [Gammaproteobacteria bacterium]